MRLTILGFLLALPTLVHAQGAQAGRAAGSPAARHYCGDSAALDDYERCGLWLDGMRLRRGSMGEAVARVGFFRAMPLVANVLGDSARQQARLYERSTRRANTYFATSMALQIAAFVVLRSYDCQPSFGGCAAHRDPHDLGFLGLTVAALGFTVASSRATIRARRHQGQAIFRHNQRFARSAGAATAAPDDAPRFLNSGTVLPSTLPFSEAVRVGKTLYLSGQIGITPGTMTLVPGGMEAQARQTMANIRTTLSAHGYSMSDIVKCTVMLADMTDWPAFNTVYQTFFTPPYPARSALGANGLALGALVEVECIAVRAGS